MPAFRPLQALQSLSTLQWAFVVSVGVHAVLLTVRFVDPERFDRVFQDKPLEVILVNAKSNDKPDLAKAIAQARWRVAVTWTRAAPPHRCRRRR